MMENRKRHHSGEDDPSSSKIKLKRLKPDADQKEISITGKIKGHESYSESQKSSPERKHEHKSFSDSKKKRRWHKSASDSKKSSSPEKEHKHHHDYSSSDSNKSSSPKKKRRHASDSERKKSSSHYSHAVASTSGSRHYSSSDSKQSSSPKKEGRYASDSKQPSSQYIHAAASTSGSKEFSKTKDHSIAAVKERTQSSASVKSNFELFYGIKSVFSQMYPCHFRVDGMDFNCAEQYFHFRKAVLFGDYNMAQQIMAARDPKVQKKLGRKVQNFDKTQWGRTCEGVVRQGSECKYQQNAELKKVLFDTYPRTLVEASPRDRLWGIGLGVNNPKAHNSNNWRGKNLLGYALTRVRDKMMREEGLISDTNPFFARK